MNSVSWVHLVVAQASEAPEDVTIWSLLGDASGMVMAVLVLLVLASVASWFIIGFKAIAIRRAVSQSNQFNDVFWQSKRLDQIYDRAQTLQNSPVSQVFQAGYVELRKIKGQGGGEGTMRTQLGGTAVARLSGTTCGACHLSLPAVEIDRLRRDTDDGVPTCTECGALLVL